MESPTEHQAWNFSCFRALQPALSLGKSENICSNNRQSTPAKTIKKPVLKRSALNPRNSDHLGMRVA